MSKSPLDGRAGLKTSWVNPLIGDLRRLREVRGIQGAVLISFRSGRVGVNSSGDGDRWGDAMLRLGDAILAQIDDGAFDDLVTGVPLPERRPVDVAALLAEVGALPDPQRCLMTHNEQALIDFCHRLGAALRSRLPSADSDGLAEAMKGLMP